MFLRALLLTVAASLLSVHAETRVAPGNWIPIRWWDPSPKSLDVLEGTPINCLVLPESVLNDRLITEAHRRNLVVLALASNVEEARRINLTSLDGVVLKEIFPTGSKPLVSNASSVCRCAIA